MIFSTNSLFAMILHIGVITPYQQMGKWPEQRICAVDADFKLVTLRVAVVDVVILGDMSLYSSAAQKFPEATLTQKQNWLPQTCHRTIIHPADAQESSFFKPPRVASRKTQREDF